MIVLYESVTETGVPVRVEVTGLDDVSWRSPWVTIRAVCRRCARPLSERRYDARLGVPHDLRDHAQRDALRTTTHACGDVN